MVMDGHPIPWARREPADVIRSEYLFSELLAGDARTAPLTEEDLALAGDTQASFTTFVVLLAGDAK